MKTYLILLILTISITSNAEETKANCFVTPQKAASAQFEKVIGYEEVDLNNDGVKEYVYTGDCWRKGCLFTVFLKIKGCYKNIYSGDNVEFLTKNIPEPINEKFNNHLKNESEFKLISDYQHNCAGYIRSNSVHMYSLREEKYIQIYNESVNFCHFR